MRSLVDSFPSALVTGSSSGLGLAIAEMLVEAGVQVVGVSRQPGELAGHPLFEHWPCDLSASADLNRLCQSVFEAHPEVTLVINNAGFGVLDRLERMPVESIADQYEVMLLAPTLVARAAVAHFRTVGGGCVVNVSSLAAELPLPLMPVYNACKAGLSALSQSMILELGNQSELQVIDFRPGDFRTAFASRMTGQVDWDGVDLRAVMDRHHAIAPDVTVALKGLRRALLGRRSGVVRVGKFFQARIAPWGRLLPGRLLLRIIRSYYKH